MRWLTVVPETNLGKESGLHRVAGFGPIGAILGQREIPLGQLGATAVDLLEDVHHHELVRSRTPARRFGTGRADSAVDSGTASAKTVCAGPLAVARRPGWNPT